MYTMTAQITIFNTICETFLVIAKSIAKLKTKTMETQFMRDWESPMMINGEEANKGYYNLVLSIRDLKLWKMGMKPNRYWKISDVKRYFGIKGNVDKCIETLEIALRQANGEE